MDFMQEACLPDAHPTKNVQTFSPNVRQGGLSADRPQQSDPFFSASSDLYNSFDMRNQKTGQRDSPSRGNVVSFISALLFSRFSALYLVIGVALIESVLLAKVPENVYEIGTVAVLLVPLWTIWFWLTVGWGIWFLSFLLSFSTHFTPIRIRGGLRLLLLGVTSIILFIYLGSWGLYFRTGRFASIESIRFFMAIIDNNWLYLYPFGKNCSDSHRFPDGLFRRAVFDLSAKGGKSRMVI